MRLEVYSPVFAGPGSACGEVAERRAIWAGWLAGEGYSQLKAACSEGVGVQICGPNDSFTIPSRGSGSPVRIIFPPEEKSMVEKGISAQLCLMNAVMNCQAYGRNPWETIFVGIDGSGAFHYDSLSVMARAFARNPNTAVIFGRRPKDKFGLTAGRREAEHFEHFLLGLHRKEQLQATFGPETEINPLPDGQAGCWGFRLSAVNALGLSATAYVEFDLLASTIDAELPAAFSDPLPMTERKRHSTASAAPVTWSMAKLEFIMNKLRISRADIRTGWKRFVSAHPNHAVNMLPSYGASLDRFCA